MIPCRSVDGEGRCRSHHRPSRGNPGACPLVCQKSPWRPTTQHVSSRHTSHCIRPMRKAHLTRNMHVRSCWSTQRAQSKSLALGLRQRRRRRSPLRWYGMPGHWLLRLGAAWKSESRALHAPVSRLVRGIRVARRIASRWPKAGEEAARVARRTARWSEGLTIGGSPDSGYRSCFHSVDPGWQVDRQTSVGDGLQTHSDVEVEQPWQVMAQDRECWNRLDGRCVKFCSEKMLRRGWHVMQKQPGGGRQNSKKRRGFAE